jgi:hydroxyacylglutathione hydrolase
MKMKQIYPDLWQTQAEHPFFGVTSHAYLLVRETGNVLFYSTGLSQEYDKIHALSGITYQYLSHSDEAGPALVKIKELFGSNLCCHRLDEPAVSKAATVDCTFDKREIVPGNGGITYARSHSR